MRAARLAPRTGTLDEDVMDFIPCSMALWAASSAASWAAKGVDLREPLNPFTPDDDDTTFPDTSVMVTMVLLNDAVMCAMPLWMLFLAFLALVFGLATTGWSVDMFRPSHLSREVAADVSSAEDDDRFAAARLPVPSVLRLIICPLRGPLRVRALVLVRWP